MTLSLHRIFCVMSVVVVMAIASPVVAKDAADTKPKSLVEITVSNSESTVAGETVKVAGEVTFKNTSDEAVMLAELAATLRKPGQKEPVAMTEKVKRKDRQPEVELAAGESKTMEYVLTLTAAEGQGETLKADEKYVLVVRSGKFAGRTRITPEK